MKKLLLFACALMFSAALAAQTNLNISLLSTWDDDTLPVASPGGLNLQYSGIWGMAVNNREYAILGGAMDVLVFDITTPASPVLAAKFPGNQVTVWREFKSYKNRLYAVSDNTQEGLMIVDFSQAPASITQTYFSNQLFNAAHTITLDTVSGHIYLNGGSSGSGMTILSVKDNPDVPILVAKIDNLPGGYIHDSYVRNDTLYASSGYNGYHIYDFKTNPAAPTELASTTTGGYNHNSWITSDGKYAYYTEEVPRALPIQIVDLSGLTTNSGIELIGNGFLDPLTPGVTPEPVPHNLYIKGDLLYDSQYEDGLLIYDIKNRTQPVLVAHYDTHPENTVYNGYYGNWGNYPWLPSGTIIAGDMQNGLFVLQVDSSITNTRAPEILPASISPNPASNQVRVALDAETLKGQQWSCYLMNTAGTVVQKIEQIQQTQAILRVENLPIGMYYVQIRRADGLVSTKKIIIQ